MIVGVNSDGQVAMGAAQDTGTRGASGVAVVGGAAGGATEDQLAEFAELVDCGDLVDYGNEDDSRAWRFFAGFGLLA